MLFLHTALSNFANFYIPHLFPIFKFSRFPQSPINSSKWTIRRRICLLLLLEPNQFSPNRKKWEWFSSHNQIVSFQFIINTVFSASPPLSHTISLTLERTCKSVRWRVDWRHTPVVLDLSRRQSTRRLPEWSIWKWMASSSSSSSSTCGWKIRQKLDEIDRILGRNGRSRMELFFLEIGALVTEKRLDIEYKQKKFSVWYRKFQKPEKKVFIWKFTKI